LSQEIRTASYLLHPPLLDESGISSALSWYVQGLAERSSLAVDLKVPDDLGRLPSEMELLIFRLVQECLTNIHRHSESKTALIRIEREDSNVYVEVQDRGRGMSPERLTEIQSQGTGVGIRGMRERVRHFRGDLVIESNDSGTKVYATLPLKTALSTHKRNMKQGVA
jgi:signal transduction histidine kinase